MTLQLPGVDQVYKALDKNLHRFYAWKMTKHSLIVVCLVLVFIIALTRAEEEVVEGYALKGEDGKGCPKPVDPKNIFGASSIMLKERTVKRLAKYNKKMIAKKLARRKSKNTKVISNIWDYINYDHPLAVPVVRILFCLLGGFLSDPSFCNELVPELLLDIFWLVIDILWCLNLIISDPSKLMSCIKDLFDLSDVSKFLDDFLAV